MFTLRCALRSLPKGQKVSYISRCYGASIPGLCESKDPSSSSDAVSSELIYEGRYWKSLRRIRRVSLGSCSTGLVIVVSDSLLKITSKALLFNILSSYDIVHSLWVFYNTLIRFQSPDNFLFLL